MPLDTTGGYIYQRRPSRIGAKTMTDRASFADKVRDHATDDDSPHAH